MIKKGNVLLQVSVPKELVEAMNLYCQLVYKKLGIHITKGYLVLHMFNHLLDTELDKLQALENKEEN